MNGLAVAAAGGALAGLGVLLLVRDMLPAAPPDLARALARLDGAHRPAPSTGPADGGPGSGVRPTVRGRCGAWLARRAGAPEDLLPGNAGAAGRRLLTVPAADLRLLREDLEPFLVRKAALALAGLALPTATAAGLALLGAAPPPAVPAAVSLAGALAGFVLPDVAVRARAGTAREAFRHAAGAYLDLVALERAADGGPAEALHRAAAVGHGWQFARIRDALDRARLSGQPPWTALAELAEEMGAEDLRDLADIVALAGGDGAAVYDTLRAKAAALRARALTDAEAAANAASERMTLPAVLLGLGFLVLVCYPGLARVLT